MVNKVNNSILKMFLLLMAGVAVTSVWFGLYYDIPIASTCIGFCFAVICVTPFYIAMYYCLQFARKGWGAFLVGALWYPLNYISFMAWIYTSSVLFFYFHIALITFIDCLIVAAMLWVIQKWKVCTAAVASLVLGIFVLAILLLHEFTGTTARHTYIEVLPFTMLGLILGIVAPLRIKKNKQWLSGYVPAVFGIIINGLLVFCLVANCWYEHQRQVRWPRVCCATNLSSLAKAMTIYASDDKDYRFPTAAKWCDLLLQGGYVNEKQFVCRAARDSGDNGRCHYAINPNCRPTLPGDMVLLFETKGGWNQFGGPEILTAENHKPKGCNILFNDGYVKFVKTKDLGKLKWKIEEGK